MKNKTLLFFASFIIGIIAVFVVGFTSATSVYSPNSSGGSIVQEGSNTIVGGSSSSEPGGDDYSKPNDDEITAVPLEFVISNDSVQKTKKMIGETTTLELSFKVFVSNKSKEIKKLLGSAFAGKYAISNYALFFNFELLGDEKTKIVEENETIDFDFKITYIVTNTNEFNDNEKFNLDLSYLGESVISATV